MENNHKALDNTAKLIYSVSVGRRSTTPTQAGSAGEREVKTMKNTQAYNRLQNEGGEGYVIATVGKNHMPAWVELDTKMRRLEDRLDRLDMDDPRYQQIEAEILGLKSAIKAARAVATNSAGAV